MSTLSAFHPRNRHQGRYDFTTLIMDTRERTVDMAQGQKKSRFVAWTFLNRADQEAWHNRREATEPATHHIIS